MSQPSRFPLTTIVETTRIPTAAAAAIIVQISVRLDRWISLRAPEQVIVPRIEDLALERGGRVRWRRGRRVPSSASVESLGQLLESLLDPESRRHTPPGLMYVIARATDRAHLAPIRSIREFATAVARYMPPRPMAAVDALIARHLACTRAMPLCRDESTIADVRRSRRAGGTSLATIADDTHIPVSLLRELEWGMYDNWRLPHSAAVVAVYAERSGMDPADVLAIIAREQHQGALLPVRVERGAPTVRPRSPRSAHEAIPFGLAALLVAALAVGAPVDRHDDRPSARVLPAHQTGARVLPAAATVPDRSPETLEAPPAEVPPETTKPVDSRPRRVGGRTWKGKPTRAPHRPAPASIGAVTEPRSPERDGGLATDATAAARTDATPRPALVRLARAIAGDGRHRVEPFPRPAEAPPD